MSELQATLEFCVELHKFYNVDLFLRGYYNLQLALRTSSSSAKLPCRIEINSNSPNKNKDSASSSGGCGSGGGGGGGGGSIHSQSSVNTTPSTNTSTATASSGTLVPPASSTTKSASQDTLVSATGGNNAVVKDSSTSTPPTSSTSLSQDGSTISSNSVSTKSFRILFRNEELELQQIFVFRVHFQQEFNNSMSLVKLLEELHKVEYFLDIKLCFQDNVVSSRTVQIHYYLSQSIHYYRNVFFDYFHLCAVSFSIHGGLIAIHISKNTLLNNKPRHDELVTAMNSMPLALPSSSTSCIPSSSSILSSQMRFLSNAKTMHEAIMNILLDSNSALKSKLIEFLQVLGRNELLDSFKGLMLTLPGGQVNFETFMKERRTQDEMEEFLLRAHKQIAHLCAENILLWHRFLDLIISKDPVRVYLANLHHQLRVKRFSEGFYMTTNSVRSAYTCKDYSPIVELLKKSINYTPLLLECVEIDGDSHSIPIIFEDQFCEESPEKQYAIPPSASTTITSKPTPPQTTTMATVGKMSHSSAIKPACSCLEEQQKLQAKDPLAFELTFKLRQLKEMEERDKQMRKKRKKFASTHTLSLPHHHHPRRHSSTVRGGGGGGHFHHGDDEGGFDYYTCTTTKPVSKGGFQDRSSSLRKYNSTPFLQQLDGADSTTETNTSHSLSVNNSLSGSRSTTTSGWGSHDEGQDLDDDVEEAEVAALMMKPSASSVDPDAVVMIVPPPAQFQDDEGVPSSKGVIVVGGLKTLDDEESSRIVGPPPPVGFEDGGGITNARACSCPPPLTSSTAAGGAALVTAKRGVLSSAKEKQKEVGGSSSTNKNSDKAPLPIPYFIIPDELRIFHPKGLHLIICVHGLDGSCHDLRLFKIYLQVSLPGHNLHFLMSETNQDGTTFTDFNVMTEKFTNEILNYMETNKLNPSRISFVGHSLGNIIIRSALTKPSLAPLLPKLHAFVSLSGPHLGTLYNTGIVNMGMWLMQKWKKSSSLLQLQLRDNQDLRKTFIYKLSENSNLDKFKYVLLCGSSQDRYVPVHSAHIINCKASLKDTSTMGEVYREMVMNILSGPLSSKTTKLIRYDVHHAINPHTANSLIGRAAHIAVLDSEIFIEKFLSVSAVKYFQ